MTARTATIVLLIALLGAGSVQLATIGTDSPPHMILWTTVLFGFPVLIACVLTRQRWALMGAVMYGTVGLALDIATAVASLLADREAARSMGLRARRMLEIEGVSSAAMARQVARLAGTTRKAV